MAFDGGFLYKMTAELQSACECHVDKIYQPSKDELIFLMRKKGFARRLLINGQPGFARIQFTENRPENPLSPPMFCMLARKHLSSARLIGITQPGLERLVELTFASVNEMGDPVQLRLICEFLGNRTNFILVGADGRILSALRYSDAETASRLILPGAAYVYPSKQDKRNPLETNLSALCAVIEADSFQAKAILNTVEGFSPLICREIAEQSEKNGSTKQAREQALAAVIASLTQENTPLLLLDEGGAPLDFTYTDITQYGTAVTKKRFDSFSDLLDAYYTVRETVARIRRAAQDISGLITTLRSRTEKKLALRLEELKACENREQLRMFGELLKANLYAIPNGSTFAEVPNYYDDAFRTVRIPLNPALSPSKNAAKYFKDYKKSYTAQQTLTSLTEKDREELQYFDSVLDSISRCRSLADLAEIREELTEAGYLRAVQGRKKRPPAQTGFLEVRSSEGYRILVGKNNRQNDVLTLSLASKNDMWFHVKNFPGSHVVVLCQGGALSEETVRQAACLAAENSKAAGSSGVPVDYTPVKYVKKPNGAKPGMVIYTTNQTVYVTPHKEVSP